MMLENANAFLGKYKTTNHDAVLKIQTYLSNNLAIYHVKGHQDTGIHKLNLPEHLDI